MTKHSSKLISRRVKLCLAIVGVVSFAVFLFLTTNFAYGRTTEDLLFTIDLPLPTPTQPSTVTPEPTFTPTPISISVSTQPEPCESLEVKVTAYSLKTLTFTETRPAIGTVAVDPNVIPLDSEIFVPGYGFGVARDKGELIIGRHIDIWLPTKKEALAWGVKDLEIKVCFEPS